MVVRGLLIHTLAGRGGRERASSAEPVGPGGEGAVEDELAAGLDGPGGAVVDRGRGVQADPGMAVLVVVVGEEQVAECACVLQGGEGAGEDGAVLEGLERGLGERVVVGDVRAGMAAGDVQVGKQGGDVLGGHRGAVIGVDVARSGAAVRCDRVLHERFRQVTALAVMRLPADGLAGEDVQHHVQVEIGAAPGSFQLGDVPGPTWSGPSTTSSSRTRGGWAAWARRSRYLAASVITRYMVRMEAR